MPNKKPHPANGARLRRGPSRSAHSPSSSEICSDLDLAFACSSLSSSLGGFTAAAASLQALVSNCRFFRFSQKRQRRQHAMGQSEGSASESFWLAGAGRLACPSLRKVASDSVFLAARSAEAAALVASAAATDAFLALIFLRRPVSSADPWPADAHRRDLLSLLLDRDLQDPASFGPTSVLKRRWVIATWRSHLTSPSPRPPATRRRGSAAQLVLAAAAACRTSRGSRARRQLCPGRCTPGGKRRSDRLGSTSWARSGR